jgi:hypothetical protein
VEQKGEWDFAEERVELERVEQDLGLDRDSIIP